MDVVNNVPGTLTMTLCLYDVRTKAVSGPHPVEVVNLDEMVLEVLSTVNAQLNQRCAVLYAWANHTSHRVTGRVVERQLGVRDRTLLRICLDAAMSL